MNLNFEGLRIDVYITGLGHVVQSIVSLTSWLRGQLLKCFMTLLPNTSIFIVEKISAKASHIFATKNIGELQVLTFEILTKH